MERASSAAIFRYSAAPIVPAILALLLTLYPYSLPAADFDDLTIGCIDTYGLRSVSREAVIAAAGLEVGHRLSGSSGEIIPKLEAIPGVKKAAVQFVYGPLLENNAAGLVVYIGIDEDVGDRPHFHAAPTADVALPAEITDAYEEYERAFAAAMERGNFSEDDSQGHSLMADEAGRSAQGKFVPLAGRNLDKLIDVLQRGKDSEKRAIAADVIAYDSDKKRVAGVLSEAILDPDDVVRNNAMRALSIIFEYSQRHPEAAIQVSVDPFVDLLDSLVWTDRNKALAVLLALPSEEAVLAKLRERALPSLAEMARWKAAHARMAFLLLGRVAGLSDEESRAAWKSGERDSVIARALKSGPK